MGGILLLILALAAGGALAYVLLSTPKRPVLDAQSLCPVDGPQGINVVLVDTSDDLPETTRREVLVILDDLIATLPPFYKLDIRVLDIAGARSRSLFSKCNPGDGAGLNEWTDNPRIARLRWIENFRKPASDAVKNSMASAKAANSPLMAAIQDIAIDQFSSAANQNAKKTLIVISDMIEYTRDYSQYPTAGDLSFQRYKQSPAYLKFRTDLHGATVVIRYVTRQPKGQPLLNDIKHGEFWIQWMKDNGASTTAVKRLQGT
ncbi:hypothetical protein [Bradyrhizobium symbiodeficiens]|uniref:hypothetical protein n=1 Tax=Bradyrhizobium symbiodeficiens TaxID=1404367 RepID=UPI000BA1954F|nr:hypothetical protein [Bradyrhizobium symbiodeficiens]AWM06087.1 hypothetical protein CIT39_06225 [Bradyrhizobium symbiodeficiens]